MSKLLKLTSNSEDVAKENYTVQKVNIKNCDYKIPAIITLPLIKNDEKYPIVIMCHGTASNKDEVGNGYEIYASTLAEIGIASIRFDFIGTGDSKVDYIKYNFTTAISDTKAVIEYANFLKYIDNEKIGLLGWSQGGTIALLTASQKANIKSVVTWAGAVDLSILYNEESFKEAKTNGFSILEFNWRDDLKLGLKWYEDYLNTDLLAEIGKIKCPILAINGEDDDVILPKYANIIVNSSPNKASKAYIINNTEHTFSIFSGNLRKFDELCEKTTNWFISTLI